MPDFSVLPASNDTRRGSAMAKYLLIRSLAFFGLTSLSTAVLALPYLA